jgi:spermidine synthase
VAAVGLGAGSLACYARRGGRFTFYEIDPTVIRIARDPRLFTFLSDCPVSPRVVAGDGRRSLTDAPARSFGLVVIDAFNSDAIPLHLITREAFELYLSRTTAGGALLFHLTNRYLDLEPVVANIASDLRLSCRIQRHAPSAADRRLGIDESTWALLARRTGDLGRPARDARWRACRPDRSAETWTDDFSDPLSVVDWG